MTDSIVLNNSNTVILNSDVVESIVVDNNNSTVLQESIINNSVINNNNEIVSQEIIKEVVVLSSGQQGPPGINEEDVVYSKRIDFINDNLLYKGEAEVGSNNSQAVWRIRRITLGTDGDVTEEWADGNPFFDNIWDNRLSITYT